MVALSRLTLLFSIVIAIGVLFILFFFRPALDMQPIDPALEKSAGIIDVMPVEAIPLPASSLSVSSLPVVGKTHIIYTGFIRGSSKKKMGTGGAATATTTKSIALLYQEGGEELEEEIIGVNNTVSELQVQVDEMDEEHDAVAVKLAVIDQRIIHNGDSINNLGAEINRTFGTFQFLLGTIALGMLGLGVTVAIAFFNILQDKKKDSPPSPGPPPATQPTA